MSGLTLTADELEDVTGRLQAKLQIKWLITNGWKFSVDAHGYPKVARSFYESTYGGKPEVTKRRGVRTQGLSRMSHGAGG